MQPLNKNHAKSTKKVSQPNHNGSETNHKTSPQKNHATSLKHFLRKKERKISQSLHKEITQPVEEKNIFLKNHAFFLNHAPFKK